MMSLMGLSHFHLWQIILIEIKSITDFDVMEIKQLFVILPDVL